MTRLSAHDLIDLVLDDGSWTSWDVAPSRDGISERNGGGALALLPADRVVAAGHPHRVGAGVGGEARPPLV